MISIAVNVICLGSISRLCSWVQVTVRITVRIHYSISSGFIAKTQQNNCYPVQYSIKKRIILFELINSSNINLYK